MLCLAAIEDVAVAELRPANVHESSKEQSDGQQRDNPRANEYVAGPLKDDELCSVQNAASTYLTDAGCDGAHAHVLVGLLHFPRPQPEGLAVEVHDERHDVVHAEADSEEQAYHFTLGQLHVQCMEHISQAGHYCVKAQRCRDAQSHVQGRGQGDDGRDHERKHGQHYYKVRVLPLWRN